MPRLPLPALALGAISLAACGTLSEINGEPQLSEVADPAQQEEARLVQMPMPTPPAPPERNSLWATDKRSFFRDQRAQEVGDILTVNIDIADNARLRNSTARSRDNEESVGLGAIFGAESVLDNALNDSFEADNAVDLESRSRVEGAGEINRNEQISLRVAAVVTEQLPNGNFVIAGRQEVRVNHELRELRIAGVIRPEDISARNTIDYFQIAEARVSYGGRGTISRVQKPKVGQRLYEFVVPY